MCSVKFWAHPFLVIATLLLLSCASRGTSVNVSPGQRIEMAKFSVIAPSGKGWTIRKDEFVEGNISFRREDPFTIMSVTPGFLRQVCDADNEDTIASMIFAGEERNMTERGATRSYAPSGFAKSLIEIEGKTLHVMSYSIASAPPRPVANYNMYIYFPPDWKQSKVFYGFLIGVDQRKDDTVHDPRFTEIHSIISSFQTR